MGAEISRWTYFSASIFLTSFVCLRVHSWMNSFAQGTGAMAREAPAAAPRVAASINVTRLIALDFCWSPPTSAPYRPSVCVAFHLVRLDLLSKNVQLVAFVVIVVVVSSRVG
jgi:hypothetical protein